MILKKPYAFLIKYFRLIHILLSVMVTFLMVKSFNIYGFFSRYVSNVYAALGDASPSNYITVFMFLVTIVVVLSSTLMYFLMKKKDKPKLLYILLSVYYLIYFIGIVIYFSLFKSLETTSIPIKEAMVYRDITLIFILPQIAFVIMTLIRGVGFDIKKFNFSKDLKELEMEDADSEEFEFVLGIDSYKYKRFINRRIREFKYYVLENKLMFTILAGLTAAVFGIVIILNLTVYNRTYGKNQKIIANNLSIKVNNSYLTNIDYTGKIIEKGKYFLVVNTTFTNNSGMSTVLNLSSYELKTKQGTVYPTISRNNYFADLGAGYQKEKIENGSSDTYILVYELNEKQRAKSYKMEIVDQVNYKAGTMNAKIKNVTLKPRTYFETKDIGTYKLGDTITMYESILNNTSLKVDSFKFNNKFTYKYEACIRSSCSNKTDIVTADAAKKKTLLILTGTLNQDKTSTFATNLKTKLSFFDAFVQIRYDDKISDVTNKSLISYTEGYVLEVDENAKNASNVDLVITIRDKRYILDLK